MRLKRRANFFQRCSTIPNYYLCSKFVSSSKWSTEPKVKSVGNLSPYRPTHLSRPRQLIRIIIRTIRLHRRTHLPMQRPVNDHRLRTRELRELHDRVRTVRTQPVEQVNIPMEQIIRRRQSMQLHADRVRTKQQQQNHRRTIRSSI